MQIHYLQHVAFEGLGSMQSQLLNAGHTITSTALYKNEPLPEITKVDWLIVMGGPMGIYDYVQYPWLAVEKQFIQGCIKAGKKVLGICLGAQLIADILGAAVTKNPHREIGWFPIQLTGKAKALGLSNIFADAQPVFHWHGDTFAIPQGAIPLASSKACMNQGFIYKNNVLALQFHLETTLQSAKDLIEHCGDELDGSQYVQSSASILQDLDKFDSINNSMSALIEWMQK
ncbi:glutamine amidotransferase [Alteromonadaceae bacterium BrNp21-10]|nr:glutamine amidotransferase [Alteromonadaceae bacterium BrNp21-10]